MLLRGGRHPLKILNLAYRNFGSRRGISINAAGIQMLGEGLRKPLFGREDQPPPPLVVSQVQKELQEAGLDPHKVDGQPEINFALPSLEGEDVASHFRNIGTKLAAPYMSLGFFPFLPFPFLPSFLPSSLSFPLAFLLGFLSFLSLSLSFQLDCASNDAFSPFVLLFELKSQRALLSASSKDSLEMG